MLWRQKLTIAVSVLGWILVAPIVMRFGPARAFEKFRPIRPQRAASAPPVKELVAFADRFLLARVFGRLLFRTRCFKRSLVLFRLLRLHGYDARAVVGYDRAGESLLGHAWVMIDGRRIEDPTFTPSRDFTPFLEIGERIERLTGA